MASKIGRAVSRTFVSPIYLQRANLHYFAGGPQNNNDRRNIRLHWRALVNRYKLVGFWETWNDFAQAHEINFGETLGTLRGIDEFGNKYYENLDNQYGRHRWVNYATRRRQSDHCATIPPGWWGWIHHARSGTPADADFSKNPKWVLLHSENYTGTDKRYLPTNYGQAESSEWKGMRYSTWNPNDPTNDTDVETMRNERTQQPRITS